MPRAPRYEITGCPQYAAQIGHNSQPLFRNTVDFCVYRDALKDALSECDCDLHAFRFGDARVDLLVTQHSPGGVSRLMQHVGRRYAAYFNRTYFRTGTLYAGRYKSALVQPGRFAFACQRLIDSLADDERHPMSTRSSREPCNSRTSRRFAQPTRLLPSVGHNDERARRSIPGDAPNPHASLTRNAHKNRTGSAMALSAMTDSSMRWNGFISDNCEPENLVGRDAHGKKPG